ncbi:hypothetical protein P378_01385 [Desulforamulus profundi]|uniref:DUF5412 domain-containing protein n=1 Tax=Desulforamulus profundi TaxID=1383067 RepID=A0A2C6MIY1_9FIRM|nr:DUF5412 family protein [Desulforamulus profundi]PHJ39784.1 hypothetical protein P378_01385 [Desulforamulus profundi]
MRKKPYYKIIAAISLFLLLAYFGIHYFLFSLSYLPEGTLIKQSLSPNGEYTVNAYLVDGGSLSSNAVRVELQNNKSGKKRNIYWDYRINTVEFTWINDTDIIINGHKIDIKKDTYDWRRDKTKTQ